MTVLGNSEYTSHPGGVAKSLRQPVLFGGLWIVTNSLPLAKNTTQRFTRLWRPTSTCRITTNPNNPNFTPRLGETTRMIYFPTNFHCILPHPVFLLLIPFTVKLFFTYRTGLVCQYPCWCWDRGIGLRSGLFDLRCGLVGRNNRTIFVAILDPFLSLVIVRERGYFFSEIPSSGLTSAHVLTKFLVDAEMPVKVRISFCSTVFGVGETASTGTTLQVVWIVKDINKIFTGSISVKSEYELLLKR